MSPESSGQPQIANLGRNTTPSSENSSIIWRGVAHVMLKSFHEKADPGQEFFLSRFRQSDFFETMKLAA
jgi:hypothetical protein